MEQSDDGQVHPVLPTRKRQGTLEQAGRKRPKFAEVAPGKELPGEASDVEGHHFFNNQTEGSGSLSSNLHEGGTTEVGTHEKHGVLLLDVFSGTAGVAAAFIQLGGEALGLDHVVDKKRVKGPVAKVDLCKRESQELVFKWLDDRKIDGVMLAPPCGTSSRAREIPIFQSKHRAH